VYATGEPVSGTAVPARWDSDGDGVPEEHVVDYVYAPLSGPDGRPEGVVAVVQDVAERARLQAAERRARAAAEASAGRLAAVLDSLPDAAAVLDAEWRYRYVNPAAVALHTDIFAVTGAPPQLGGRSAVGHVAWELFPWLLGTKFELESRRAVAEGRVAEYVEYVPPLDRWYETRIVPAGDGAVTLNRDVTAQRAAAAERERLLEAERAARERTERLQAVTAALARAFTAPEIASVVAAEGSAALGAAAGAVYALDAAGRTLEALALVGLPGETGAAYWEVALDAPLPMADVVRTGEPMFWRDRGELAARYPALAGAGAASGTEAWYAVPMRAGARVLGGLAFGFAAARELPAADRAFAEALGQQCAQALERARLFEAERQAGDRARRLQRLTAHLNQATTREQIADVIFEGALAAVGADAGSLAVVHADADGAPARFEVIRVSGYDADVQQRYLAFPVTPGRPLSDAVRRRRIVFVGSPAEWRATYPDASEDLAALGFVAFAAVPVAVGERVLAAISFSFRAPPAFDDAARTFLATVGEQCALALERQRLHDAELRQAERNAALVGTIQDGFIALDRELRYAYVNARAEALLGRPAGALVGRTHAEAFPDAQDTPLHRGIVEARDAGRRVEVEAFSPIARRWLEARIFPAPGGGVTVVFEDATPRRRRQDAAAFMAEASRLLATSLDYATTLRAVAEAAVPRLGDWCAVDVVADPTAGAWPPRVERLAVVHADPRVLALGAELTRRYPTDWSAEAGVAAVLRHGTPFFVPAVTDAMLVAAARDGEHLGLMRALQFSSIIVVPLVARGLTLGALTLCMTESGRHYDDADLALAVDLAQRAGTAVDNARLFRDAERERATAERARAEAEAANRAKSEFLAVMSHELRTPLNAIGGYAELIQLGIRGPVSPEQLADLERIQRSQKHLLGLINEVLNYARLESGRVRYDVEAVAVGGAFAAVEALVQPQVRAKGLALHVAAGEPGLAVRADAEKLRQVLLNLLSNAVKFTDAGGRVTLDCAVRPGPGGDVVECRVADTGVGIADDQLETIFEPFVQVGRALHNPGEGTGLGLAISRDLARGMGGDLTAASRPGEGSTFTLALPRA
jgi:PAS domain S-box-containing protein